MQRQKSWNAVAFRAATTKQEKLRHKDTGDAGDAYIFLLDSFMTYWNLYILERIHIIIGCDLSPPKFQRGDKGTGVLHVFIMFHPSLSLSRFPAWLFPMHLTLPVLRWCLLRPTRRAWPQWKNADFPKIFRTSEKMCEFISRDVGKSEQSLINANWIGKQWTWKQHLSIFFGLFCPFFRNSYYSAASYPCLQSSCLTHCFDGAILSDRARHRWTRFLLWVRWY